MKITLDVPDTCLKSCKRFFKAKIGYRDPIVYVFCGESYFGRCHEVSFKCETCVDRESCEIATDVFDSVLACDHYENREFTDMLVRREVERTNKEVEEYGVRTIPVFYKPTPEKVAKAIKAFYSVQSKQTDFGDYPTDYVDEDVDLTPDITAEEYKEYVDRFSKLPTVEEDNYVDIEPEFIDFDDYN